MIDEALTARSNAMTARDTGITSFNGVSYADAVASALGLD
jgi:hypothetical protein